MDSRRSFRLSLFTALLLNSVMVSAQDAEPSPENPNRSEQTATLIVVGKPLPPALTNPGTEASTVVFETSVFETSVLETSTEAQATFPAVGLCPVITDYLYDLCQQNPDDPSCQPNN